MRLTCFFLFVVSLTVSAHSVSQTISLSGKDMPLKEVFSAIKKQTGFVVFYKTELLRNTRPVSFSVSGMLLEDFMEMILLEQPLSFRFVDNTIILSKKPLSFSIDPLLFDPLLMPPPVTGVIMSADGVPLEGASIKIRDQSIGTTSDADGRFSINVKTGQVLVFSYTGYERKEIKIGKSRTLSVTLKILDELMQEIVVGYGTQRKRDITGAITSVSEKQIERKQPVSIFDAIQGEAPGVRVMSSTGAPGEESGITIRGISTLSDEGVSPLYIVDGVPMDNINSINPGDVQSLEILKDAASAAIYGSRSANGVIIITTKRGSEGKARIDLNYLRGYSKLANRIPQSNRLEREIFDRNNLLGLDPKLDDSTLFVNNADNDYQAAITQVALRNQVSLGVMGGTKALKYYNSLQYLDETGIVITSYNKRLTLRTNVDYAPSKRVSMASRINFSYQTRNNIKEDMVIQQALQRPSYMALFLPDGEYVYVHTGRKNPIAEARLSRDISKIYQGILYQELDYKILRNLTFHSDVSADLTLTRRNSFSSKLLNTAKPPVNTGQDNTSMRLRVQGNAVLSYKRKLNKVHNITAMAGMNIEKNRQELINIKGSNFVTETVTTLNAAGLYDLSSLYSTASASGLVGFFGRLGYDYKSRYLINATIRRDGSSVFGSQNRWGNFPSVSVGWRFTDESFMEKLTGVLTDGKLRVSWGATGNQRIGDYDAYQQFVFGQYYYNGISGVRTNTQMGNQLLKWESTKQSDIGIDLTFLGGRITFIGDYYVKNTSNLLYSQPLPFEIGFSKARVNRGSIQNKGIELTLTGVPLRTKNLTWQTSVNWSMVRNKITSIPNDYIDDIWSVKQGEEAGDFYGYRFLGIYEYDQSNAYTEDYSTRLIPQFRKDDQGNVVIQKNNQPILTGYTYPDGRPYTGEVKQLTTNGVVSKGGDIIWENLPDEKGVYDGNIGNEDRQIIGHGQPRWSIGWSNNVNYKGFSLSCNFYGNFGGSVYNDNRRNLASFATTRVTPDPYFIYNMWKYPGQETDTYRGGDKTADNMRKGGSEYLENGSFLRLQSARLGYQLPLNLLKKVAIQDMNVYIYGTNLLTWTEYTGFDPEVGQNNVLKPGSDPGRYPRRREFGVGCKVSF